MKKIQIILAAIGLLFSNHTNAQSSRLIAYAESVYINDTAYSPATDTIAYVYSGGRGYDLLNKAWKYDNATTTNYVGTSVYTNYDVQAFDHSGNDTAFTDQNATNGGPLANNVQRLYHYNAAKYIDTETDLTWSAGVWAKSSRTVKVYDLKNELVQKTISTWDAVGDTFSNTGEVIYNTYSVSGDLTASCLLNWNSGTHSWDSSSKSSYTYDGSHDLLTTTVLVWNVSTSTWENHNIYSNSGFVAGQPLLSTTLLWNATALIYDSIERFHYTYNSSNQLLTRTNEINTTGGWKFQFHEQFYYELYTSGINNVSAKGGYVNIYPVPTNGQLTIELAWDEPQPFTIAIVDVNGRICDQWDNAAVTQYRKTISLGNIAAGSYFMKITGAKGEIVKQFVVNPHLQ